MQLGPSDKSELQRYYRLIIKLLVELKSKNKLNPNYRAAISKLKYPVDYSRLCIGSANKFDYIVRSNDLETLKKFEESVKQFQLSQTEIMNIYANLMLYAFQLLYSDIENYFIALLLGVTYGKKGKAKVKGSETLGQILQILICLYPQHGILDDILDSKFRNSLAHHHYYVRNNKLVFSEDATFTSLKEIEPEELFLRLRKTSLFASSLFYAVDSGNWNGVSLSV